METKMRTASETEVCVNKPRLSVLLALDHSGSMSGKPIKDLNTAYSRFIEQGRENKKTGSRTDIAAIGFNDDTRAITDWKQLDEADMDADESAFGCTDIDKAIFKGLEMIDMKKEMDESRGIPPSAPVMILVTDGMPTSSIDRSVQEIKRRLGKLDKNGLKTFIMLTIFVENSGLSQKEREAATATLARYTDNVIVAENADYDKVFAFIHKSIETLHESMHNGTQANVPLEQGLAVVSLNRGGFSADFRLRGA